MWLLSKGKVRVSGRVTRLFKYFTYLKLTWGGAQRNKKATK